MDTQSFYSKPQNFFSKLKSRVLEADPEKRSIIVLVILLLAIPLTVWLLQRTQIFAPKAAEPPIQLVIGNDSCVISNDPYKVSCASFPIKLTSPLGPIPDGSFSCETTEDCPVGDTCFRHQNYPGVCRDEGTECAQVITRACERVDDQERPTNCVDFPTRCHVPIGWEIQEPEPEPSYISCNTSAQNSGCSEGQICEPYCPAGLANCSLTAGRCVQDEIITCSIAENDCPQGLVCTPYCPGGIERMCASGAGRCVQPVASPSSASPVCSATSSKVPTVIDNRTIQWVYTYPTGKIKSIAIPAQQGLTYEIVGKQSSQSGQVLNVDFGTGVASFTLKVTAANACSAFTVSFSMVNECGQTLSSFVGVGSASAYGQFCAAASPSAVASPSTAQPSPTATTTTGVSSGVDELGINLTAVGSCSNGSPLITFSNGGRADTPNFHLYKNGVQLHWFSGFYTRPPTQQMVDNPGLGSQNAYYIQDVDGPLVGKRSNTYTITAPASCAGADAGQSKLPSINIGGLFASFEKIIPKAFAIAPEDQGPDVNLSAGESCQGAKSVINLDWSANGYHYNVLRNGSQIHWTTHPFTDENVTPGQTYRYQLFKSGSGVSSSNIVTVTARSCAIASPSAAASVTASPSAAASVAASPSAAASVTASPSAAASVAASPSAAGSASPRASSEGSPVIDCVEAAMGFDNQFHKTVNSKVADSTLVYWDNRVNRETFYAEVVKCGGQVLSPGKFADNDLKTLVQSVTGAPGDDSDASKYRSVGVQGACAEAKIDEYKNAGHEVLDEDINCNEPGIDFKVNNYLGQGSGADPFGIYSGIGDGGPLTYAALIFSNSEAGVGTISYQMAETEAGLNNAEQIPYLDHPTFTDFTFSNPAPGSKQIWIRFNGPAGTQPRTEHISVELVAPPPVIASLSCKVELNKQNLLLTINGERLGNGSGKVKVNSKDADITSWNSSQVVASLKPGENLDDGKLFKVVLSTSDGTTLPEVSCLVNTSVLSLGARLFCRAPGAFDVNSVKVTLVDAQGNKVDEVVSIDKDGLIKNLRTRLQTGQRYAISIKAPYSLRRNSLFTAGEGTNLISAEDDSNFILPVGDIAPVILSDGKINALDSSEMIRQWSVLGANQGRTADFNRDTKVNSIDWACMRYDFNKEDEPIPTKAAEPSPSPTNSCNQVCPQGTTCINGACVYEGRPEPSPSPQASISGRAAYFLLAPEGSGSYPVNTEFKVDLNFASQTEASNLFSAKLKFDQSKLEVVRIEKGTELTAWAEEFFDNATGNISLTAGIPNGIRTPADADQLMARIVFKAKNPGTSTIDLLSSSKIFSNSDNINILGSLVSVSIGVPVP